MKRVLVLVLCSFFVGCGGGGGGAAPPVSGGPRSTSLAKVTVKISVPSPAAAKNARLKRAFTQAASTKGILFTIYAHGTTSNPIVQNAEDISPTSTLCAVSTNGGRSCTVSFEAPVSSSNDLNVETVDHAPVSGSIPNGSNILAAQTIANVAIGNTATNTVSLSLNPVVSYFSLQPTPSTLHSFYATTFTIAPVAFDADNNMILAGSYVDPNGNATQLTLQPQCTCVSLSPATITASGTVVTGAYDGTADVPANSTQSLTINEAGSFGGSMSLLVVGPTVITHPLSYAKQPTTSAAYYGVSYVTTGSGDEVLVMDTDTASLTYGGVEPYTVSTGSVGSAITGSSGSVMQDAILPLSSTSTVYAGGTTTPYDVTYSPSLGLFAQASCTPGALCGGMTSNFASDGSSTIYWTTGSNLVAYTPGSSTATSVTSSLPASELISGLAYDTSTGNIWMADTGVSSKIYTWISSGSTLGSSVALSVAPFDVAIWKNAPYLTLNGSLPVFDKAQLSGTTPVVAAQIPTQLGNPRYLYADSSTPGGLWASEGSASGTMYLMRYDGTSVSESSLGVTNGAVGPVTGSPDGSRIFVVHYTTSGGELLEVLP